VHAPGRVTALSDVRHWQLSMMPTNMGSTEEHGNMSEKH
jgi:hypothetical protein